MAWEKMQFPDLLAYVEVRIGRLFGGFGAPETLICVLTPDKKVF
jgi:hypothetical protein